MGRIIKIKPTNASIMFLLESSNAENNKPPKNRKIIKTLNTILKIDIILFMFIFFVLFQQNRQTKLIVG